MIVDRIAVFWAGLILLASGSIVLQAPRAVPLALGAGAALVWFLLLLAVFLEERAD